MENVLASFNAVAPICLIVLAGMFFRKRKVIDPEFVRTGNVVLYKAIMPIMIFNNIFTAKDGAELNIRFIGYACLAIFLGFVLSGVLSARLIPDRRRAASFAQGMVRSNYLVVGLSMATALMGESCAASVAILTPFTTSLFAVGASVIFALFRQDGRVNLKTVALSLLHTPLLWGVAAALALRLLRLALPAFLLVAIGNISSIAAPLALVVLGAQLDLSALGRNLRSVALCSLFKLVVLPVALFVPAVVWMDLNPYELAALFFLFFSPGAVNGYFEAIQQGADSEFSGEVVVFSTLSSFVTLFLAIVILKQIGIF